MIKFMLDTNICIFTIKNKPQTVREAFNLHHGQLSISAVTLMELIDGAEKSSAPEKNLAVIEGFCARLEVLPFDYEGAAHTGMIRAELAKIGKPIGPYDQMIAGHARSRGLIVVTNNRREFERVPGLRIEDWTTATTPGL
ncbi:tRNA(fMet)-specific endonuclease VapC [Pseudomonas sp. NFIX10]|uniref:type II toxin-antitoxin system tRNA(fMet)-specific endonuclease VapC n=1 Tax=unclassified Pseudomonas TaxID=196821 RepID=UPI0008713B63|nr:MULTISPECIES: tRNA(fMet)-specific endonuclease VapC [unclassified Pseudomonas]SCW99304.1 tRNA(fMet)-specific endonuclease VapC [Pseudomonas sp. NFACC56-3]SFB26171.1 tRNA(fMet)-specific endonuclease VapC [Pseudomonas sp. NFIX10]SFE94190.1 tRNA(fMet)-specific endonuclease VapC [Pseudomonas sp. NFACC06-1]SFK98580.1 tRNA(fMet)-specific endonuclease VapC [Pseudomonas sp. NFACC52]